MAKRKKYKPKLIKLSESNLTEPFYPDLKECEKWFRVINREIFNSELPDVNAIDIRRRQGTWAYYRYTWDPKDPNFVHTELCMNDRFLTKKHFVEVLAHEMIHHYQLLHGDALGHGPNFFQWESKFNKMELRLLKSGYET